MRTRHALVALALAVATPLTAQSVMGDMHRDVNEVQKKIIDLANAIPADKYSWAPPGARSIAQVLIHIAADNYYIPIDMGKPAPASTAMVPGDYNTVLAYEARTMTKEQILAELTASFTHLHQAMGLTTDANLHAPMKFFGQDNTRGRAMIGTVTHLHEHLGQMIAYARSNNITPPWSK